MEVCRKPKTWRWDSISAKPALNCLWHFLAWRLNPRINKLNSSSSNQITTWHRHLSILITYYQKTSPLPVPKAPAIGLRALQGLVTRIGPRTSPARTCTYPPGTRLIRVRMLFIFKCPELWLVILVVHFLFRYRFYLKYARMFWCWHNDTDIMVNIWFQPILLNKYICYNLEQTNLFVKSLK